MRTPASSGNGSIWPSTIVPPSALPLSTSRDEDTMISRFFICLDYRHDQFFCEHLRPYTACTMWPLPQHNHPASLYRGHRRNSFRALDDAEVIELRARFRTFHGAYSRTALMCLTYAATILSVHMYTEVDKHSLIYGDPLSTERYSANSFTRSVSSLSSWPFSY